MDPGKNIIFISHRSEYADLVKDLKAVIQQTTGGKIHVFISEDIPKGDDWRLLLEESLRNAQHLFLIYGAPYEDWSWCFYETGYFSAQPSPEECERKVYCIKRKNVPVPSPLGHLQAIADEDELVNELIEIYQKNDVKFDAAKLRDRINVIGSRLFGKIAELRGYSRVFVSIKNEDFGETTELPANAMVESDSTTITELFGFAAPKVEWGEIIKHAQTLTGNEKIFFDKWLNETTKVIVAGRENCIVVPQTVLIARRGGKRYRLLLYQLRRQGNDVSVYEFLAVDEVGGPTIGLPARLQSLITAIRRGFRFRYELVDKFVDLDWEDFPQTERQTRASEFQNILSGLLQESYARGDISEQDFFSAFDRESAARIRKLVACWMPIYAELRHTLGILATENVSADVSAKNVECFRETLDAFRLANQEFLSLCCQCVAKEMTVLPDEVEANANELEGLVRAIRARVSERAAGEATQAAE